MVAACGCLSCWIAYLVLPVEGWAGVGTGFSAWCV